MAEVWVQLPLGALFKNRVLESLEIRLLRAQETVSSNLTTLTD
jgi:hypothetical protein